MTIRKSFFITKVLIPVLALLTGMIHVPAANAASITGVKTGSGTIAAGSASNTLTISPALSDITKTMLFYQATNGSDASPENSNIRCTLTNTTTITCDRDLTTGTATIRWHTAEFSSGVTVEHLTGTQCDATDGTAEVTINTVGSMSNTFLLYGMKSGGTRHSGDDYRTVRLISTSQVEIRTSPFSCINGFGYALQVVQFTGASVTRGVTGAMAVSSTSLTVSSLASVNTDATMLLYTYRNDPVATDATMCDRMVRGRVASATSLEFTRSDSATGCDGNAIDAIAWQRVEFTDGTTVQQVTPSMANGVGTANVGLTAVDTARTVVFAGGQYIGQASGEGSYAADDVIGTMVGRHVLTSATNLQVTRSDTNGTARWTSFVVQFEPSPTAVRLSSFTARSHADGVKLEWQTGYEADNLGFHVYREEKGERIRLTPELVAGTALLAGTGTALTSGHSYSWWDAYSNSGQPSGISAQSFSGSRAEQRGMSQATKVLKSTATQSSSLSPHASSLSPHPSSLGPVRYWLEDVDLNGTRTLHGPVTPVFSNQALPDNVSPELLSELSRRVGERYDDFWRAQDLKAKLGRRDARGQMLSAQAADQSFGDSAQAGIKPVAQSVQEPTRQDYARQKSIAGRGAVKLLVKEKGWYRVSRAELMGAGLSSRANPRTLQLYRDGREQPIKVLSERIGRIETLVAVEFYGEGLDTVSSDTRTYWLIEGGRPGKRIRAALSPQSSALSPQSSVLGTPKSFPFTVERKDRVFYFAALKNGEEESFFGPLVTSEPVDQVLALSHIDPAPPSQALLEVALQGATNVAHRVKVSFNEVELGEVVFDGQSPALVEFFLPRSYLLEGDNVVTLVSQAGETDISLIDEIRLSYWHTYSADQDSLSFTAQGGQRLTIDGFTRPSIRVIDITDPQAHQEVAGVVTLAGAGHAVTIEVPGKNERRLLAFTESEVKQPVSIIANQPSRWHQQARRADLLIISHRDFLNELEPLKALRQSQKLSVALIDVEDLYDEFSFGAKSAQAIKDLVALNGARWRRRTGYVLLAGDASFDPKNYLGLGNNDFVPTKLIETGYLKTASDDWFVDFNNDGLPEAALGRLAVRTREEAAAVVAKIIGYEQQAAGSTPNALLVADMNDGFDFEQASEEIQTLLPASMRVERIYRGSFGSDQEAKSQLIESLNQGSMLVNYLGHGSVQVVRGMLSTDEARSLTNSRLPFFIAMTCLNGFFHDVYTESLAEALLKAPRGGAVAVWASSTLSAPAEQAVMNQQLIHQLFNGGSSTLGQAAMKAKASITNPDIRRSWMLFGDPSMRLR